MIWASYQDAFLLAQRGRLSQRVLLALGGFPGPSGCSPEALFQNHVYCKLALPVLTAVVFAVPFTK
jgi:hypothetical protein